MALILLDKKYSMSWMEEEMAVAKFKMLRAKKEWIECPALWLKVKFEDKNFKHLTYKDWNHKRNEQEIKMRSLCFLSVDKIIKNSGTYQEYLLETKEVIIKKYGKKEKVLRKIEYFGLVAIVNTTTGRHRIRVVLVRKEWFSYAEYLSVMPARKMKGYSNFMGDKI